MKKVKILHSADIHFDTPFKDLKNELSNRSKEEQKKVFSDIIDICNREKVEVFLLSGDVFDNYTVSKDTLSFIREELSRLINTKVFISPGNHDPYNFKSFYKLVDWPDNTYIFKEGLEKVVLDDLNLCIFGAGFRESYVNQSMLKNVDIDENYINICVIHGEIESGNGVNEYNPITLKDIENSKLDYIALGHRHKFNGVLKSGKTSYAYSGCPQGRGFDELDEKGVLVGFVSKGYVDLDFIKTSKREYKSLDVNISGLSTYGQIKSKILKELNSYDLKKDFFKISLVGELDGGFNLQEAVLEERLKNDFYFVKVKDNTKVALDLDDSCNENTIKGIFVKNLRDKMAEADEDELEIINLALKFGLQSLTEEEVNLSDY